MQAINDLVPWIYPITLNTYHQMIDANVLTEDDRVELLDGVLVAMSPQSRRHAGAIEVLTQRLALAIGSQYRLRVQLPLSTGPTSEPEPDIAIVARDAGSPHGNHPRSALVVIEVAKDSLRKDRGPKVTTYAVAGVPEYVIVNLVEDCFEVYRKPHPIGAYQSVETYRRGSTLALESLPGVALSVDEVLG